MQILGLTITRTRSDTGTEALCVTCGTRDMHTVHCSLTEAELAADARAQEAYRLWADGR